MEVRNTTTGKIETLSIIDPYTGVDWVVDCIGNTGYLYGYEDIEAVEMNADELKFWKEYLERRENAEHAVYKAGIPQYDVIEALDGVEFCDIPQALENLLK